MAWAHFAIPAKTLSKRGDEASDTRTSIERKNASPLPEGEGKGEGEQSELWPGGITTPESPAKARVLLR